MTDHPQSVEPRGVGKRPGVVSRNRTAEGSSMRSPRGSLGATVLLLALPIAVVTQVLLGGGSALAIHLALAVGCLLVSSAVFDFETPRWMAWIGCVSMIAFAVIFLVQNVSILVGNESFSYYTDQVLGLWGEKLLLSLITFWLVGLLVTASRGKSRILGFVAMVVVVCVDVYIDISLLLIGINPFLETPVVRLLYLLPFVWLIFESRKSRPKKGS